MRPPTCGVTVTDSKRSSCRSRRGKRAHLGLAPWPHSPGAGAAFGNDSLEGSPDYSPALPLQGKQQQRTYKNRSCNFITLPFLYATGQRYIAGQASPWSTPRPAPVSAKFVTPGSVHKARGTSETSPDAMAEMRYFRGFHSGPAASHGSGFKWTGDGRNGCRCLAGREDAAYRNGTRVCRDHSGGSGPPSVDRMPLFRVRCTKGSTTVAASFQGGDSARLFAISAAKRRLSSKKLLTRNARYLPRMLEPTRTKASKGEAE